jgi:hypothetical protein
MLPSQNLAKTLAAPPVHSWGIAANVRSTSATRKLTSNRWVAYTEQFLDLIHERAGKLGVAQ